MPISPDVLDLYDQVIASQPDVQRKGATTPYTSVNGHMFSFLTQDGHLALRLPAPERDAFLVRYRTGLCEQYGKVMKEYVEGAGQPAAQRRRAGAVLSNQLRLRQLPETETDDT